MGEGGKKERKNITAKGKEIRRGLIVH